jgi:hypothetical protein
VEQEVCGSVVGYEHIDPAVVIEVGCQHTKSPAIRIGEAGAGCNFLEAAAFVAVDTVGNRLEQMRSALGYGPT